VLLTTRTLKNHNYYSNSVTLCRLLLVNNFSVPHEVSPESGYEHYSCYRYSLPTILLGTTPLVPFSLERFALNAKTHLRGEW